MLPGLLNQHWIIVSDDAMLDELARRIATQLSNNVTAHYSELQSRFDQLQVAMENMTATMVSLINKLPSTGDIPLDDDEFMN